MSEGQLQFQTERPGRWGSAGDCEDCGALSRVSADGPDELWLCRTCRHRGCPDPVVGHSITGEGHVCKQHNVKEWGRALARNREPYFRDLGLQLLAAPSDGSADGG